MDNQLNHITAMLDEMINMGQLGLSNAEVVALLEGLKAHVQKRIDLLKPGAVDSAAREA